MGLDTSELARHYDTVSVDRQFEVGKLLIERLALKRGQRVLDVGCGTGLLAEYVAKIVGAEGKVLAIDPLPLRIEIAKRREAALLEETGFALQSLEVVPNEVIQPSAEAAIEFSQASSFGNFLGHLPPDLRRAARAEIAHELEAFRVPEGIRLQGARILAIAQKPE